MAKTPKRHNDSELIRKEPCPKCGRKTSLGVYSDGHTWCFGCGTLTAGDGGDVSILASDGGDASATDASSRARAAFLEGEPQPLKARRLRLDTCERWGILSVPGKGQVFQYRGDRGQIVSQKVKSVDDDGRKHFFTIGSHTSSLLYGKHLWPAGGNKMLVVEGEVDAPSFDQALQKAYPVTSVSTGAKGAYECLKANLEYLLTFKEILLGFDNDAEGKAALEECLPLFPPGRVKVVNYGDLKDANDFLKNDRIKELINAYWRAETYRPEGIVSIRELAPRLSEQLIEGVPWKFKCMTKMTYGRRPGELYGFGGGAGIGKTELLKEEAVHTALDLKRPSGVFFLEEPPLTTARQLGGKIVGKRLHIPDAGWTDNDLKEAQGRLMDAPIHLYDHFGSTDWPTLKSRMRFMALEFGVLDFFLDHLTALAAQEEDENLALKRIMEELASMMQELRASLCFVSHLTTPEGRPHEEGGRVMLRHFRGSRAIGFWTHYAFGVERNPQARVVEHRRLTRLRCLKDRYTGTANGETVWFNYDPPSGSLEEGAEGYDIDAVSTRRNEPRSAEDYGF